MSHLRSQSLGVAELGFKPGSFNTKLLDGLAIVSGVEVSGTAEIRLDTHYRDPEIEFFL